MLGTKSGRAHGFSEGFKVLLKEVLLLWHDNYAGTVTDCVTKAKSLKEQGIYELRNGRRRDPKNQRLLNELEWHHDRGNLLRFLADPLTEPANNRAEWEPRSAVIIRKVSQCSKNGRGAHVFEAFASVMRTMAKNGIDSLEEGLYNLFGSPGTQGVPTWFSLSLRPTNQLRKH